MDQPTTCPPPLPGTELACLTPAAGPQEPVSTSPCQGSAALGPAPGRNNRPLAASLVLTAGVGCALAFGFLNRVPDPDAGRHGADISPGADAVVPRSPARPRTLEKFGVIAPRHQTPLYAKASGYVKRISRDLTLPHTPRKGVGSLVHAGEVLVEIDVPERTQQVNEKKSLLHQRRREVEEAQTKVQTALFALARAWAGVEKADLDFWGSWVHVLHCDKQRRRVQKLVGRKTTAPERGELIQLQYQEALTALGSCWAACQKAEREKDMRASELDTARAHLRVKTEQVQTAREELQLARAWAGYARVLAPYDGVIIRRDVDEGAFVQNTRSGRARPLMTVMDLSRIKVVLRLLPRETRAVKVGTRAVVRVEGGSRWQGRGWVSHVNPVVDPQSGTQRVEVSVPNCDHRLRLSGVRARVTLALE
jgi:multidrug resistance efflux pump